MKRKLLKLQSFKKTNFKNNQNSLSDIKAKSVAADG